MPIAHDWPALLAQLKARGWTQAQIADAAGVKQSTVSDLARGVTKDPGYGIGKALVGLVESGQAAPQSEAKAA